MKKVKLTPTEFIHKEYPIVIGRINDDILDGFSGNELISLIEKYLKDSGIANDTILNDNDLICPIHGTKLYKHKSGIAYCSLCHFNIQWARVFMNQEQK